MKNLFIFLGLISLIITGTMIGVLIVNMPAYCNAFILDSEGANIGAAIGGIGTIVVGIANIIMLYLAFKKQTEANDIQNELIASNAEKNALEIKNLRHQNTEYEENEKKHALEIKNLQDKYALEIKKMQDKYKAEREATELNRYLTMLDYIKKQWESIHFEDDKNKFIGSAAVKKYFELPYSSDMEKSDLYSNICLTIYEFKNTLQMIEKIRLEKKIKKEIFSIMQPFYITHIQIAYEQISKVIMNNDLKNVNAKIEMIFNKYL